MISGDFIIICKFPQAKINIVGGVGGARGIDRADVRQIEQVPSRSLLVFDHRLTSFPLGPLIEIVRQRKVIICKPPAVVQTVLARPEVSDLQVPTMGTKQLSPARVIVKYILLLVKWR